MFRPGCFSSAAQDTKDGSRHSTYKSSKKARRCTPEAHGCGAAVHLVCWGYPLVNVYITMENHHFPLENSRTKW